MAAGRLLGGVGSFPGVSEGLQVAAGGRLEESGWLELTRAGRPFPTVDDCILACAAAEPGGWDWGRQADGTDSCAEEWFAAADCMDGLSCEEQRSFFRRNAGAYPPGFACTDELDARRQCFYSTPSLDNPDGK